MLLALGSVLSRVRSSLPLRGWFPPIGGCSRGLDRGLRSEVVRTHLPAPVFTTSSALLRVTVVPLEELGWNQKHDCKISLVLLFFLPLHWLHRHQPPPRSVPGGDNSGTQTHPLARIYTFSLLEKSSVWKDAHVACSYSTYCMAWHTHKWDEFEFWASLAQLKLWFFSSDLQAIMEKSNHKNETSSLVKN